MAILTPSGGVLALSGSAPKLDKVLNPSSGSLTLTGAAPVTLFGLRPAAATLTLTPQLTRIIKGVRPPVAALILTGKIPRTPLLDVPGALIKVIAYPPIINPADQDMEENFGTNDPDGLGNQWEQIYTGPGAGRYGRDGNQARWYPAGNGDREVVNRWRGVNQRETVALAGDVAGGTFTLTWQGNTTAPIPYNATAAQVKSAVEALPGVNPGDVEVTIS